MRIVRLLAGEPPLSLLDLVESLGVTRTAVTEQLSLLMGAGFVTRTLDRAGRGRPRHLYSITDAALALFPTNERLFVPAVLRALREVAGDEVANRVLCQVSSELAQHYRRQITAQDPHERLAQLAQILRSQGVLVDLHEDQGTWTLRERSCPFWSTMGDSRLACDIEREMMSQLVQAPVQLVGCRLDGDCGCTFQLQLVIPPPDAQAASVNQATPAGNSQPLLVS